MFPEYFEESVENTPARIIMREMHGCGHMYRYCFDGTRFDVGEYDRLFPYVTVQEKPELVTRLALYRLYWPWGLKEEAAQAYWDYVTAHAGDAAEGILKRGGQGWAGADAGCGFTRRECGGCSPPDGYKTRKIRCCASKGQDI